jgi:cell division protein FtsL
MEDISKKVKKTKRSKIKAKLEKILEKRGKKIKNPIKRKKINKISLFKKIFYAGLILFFLSVGAFFV